VNASPHDASCGRRRSRCARLAAASGLVLSLLVTPRPVRAGENANCIKRTDAPDGVVMIYVRVFDGGGYVQRSQHHLAYARCKEDGVCMSKEFGPDDDDHGVCLVGAVDRTGKPPITIECGSKEGHEEREGTPLTIKGTPFRTFDLKHERDAMHPHDAQHPYDCYVELPKKFAALIRQFSPTSTAHAAATPYDGRNTKTITTRTIPGKPVTSTVGQP
jgi:hypothetical protein